MNKKLKWGLYILIGLGIIAAIIYTHLPTNKNSENQTSNSAKPTSTNRRILNVHAQIIRSPLFID